MLNDRCLKAGLALLLVAGVACSSGSSKPRPPAPGGESGSGGGGAGGSGGGATGGTGGAATDDAAAGTGEDAASPDTGGGDVGSGGVPGDGGPQAAPNFGGVGQTISVPVIYTDAPVPPLVAPECPDDPTAGFTEYRDSFVVQRPYDLAGGARVKYEDGIYTFFVNSNDKAHQPGNTTAPRTEARYPNFSTGEHIWSADVLLDAPLSKTCIAQIHNVEASIAVYLRVTDGRMFNLSTGKTILPSSYDKWFNLKIAFDTKTRQVRTFVNNCLKETSQAPNGPTPNWYFKHGVYTCDSGTCRDHYKNIHLFQKN